MKNGWMKYAGIVDGGDPQISQKIDAIVYGGEYRGLTRVRVVIDK